MLKRSISSTLAKTTETLSALAKMISHKRLARGRGQRLRIVEPLGQIVGIENDRGHADRPGQRPAPDFVDAGDPSMAVGERLALEVEMRRGREKRRGGLFLRRLQRRSSDASPVRSSASYRSRDRRAKMRRRKCRWKGDAIRRRVRERARIGYSWAMETPDPLLERVLPVLAAVPGVAAVALGGSRATGAAHAGSDYDIGLYFNETRRA